MSNPTQRLVAAKSSAPQNDRISAFLAPYLILAVGILAYHNSFSNPFIFDDQDFLINPENVSGLNGWLTAAAMLIPKQRSLVYGSFILNQTLGGHEVWGFHMVNLLIHLSAASVLYLITRKTLKLQTVDPAFALSATPLALAISLIWLAHPLQTQSVTYLSQRAESMMGLFYLLTLYAFIRADDAKRPWRWYALSLLAYWLGWKSKQVVLTAPLVILLYDRSFLSSSFKEVWQRRSRYYLYFFLIWLVCLLSLADPVTRQGVEAGIPFQKITPWQYLRTQPGVILHYLKLSFWPHPLCLDYVWRLATTSEALVPSLIVGAALFSSLWIFFRNPALGFCGISFFILLAPTSSFLPIADLANEHRMYLPLACVVVLTVAAVYQMTRRLFDKFSIPNFIRLLFMCFLTAGIVLIEIKMTISRNRDYHNVIYMWRDVIRQRPFNPRAHSSLGQAVAEEGDMDEAVRQYIEAISLQPDYADAHNNLARILYDRGQVSLAKFHFETALKSQPDHAKALNNMGVIFMDEGKIDEGIRYFSMALHSQPEYPDAAHNLKNALAEKMNE